ncbi:COG1361 family protein [Kinneretia aquatilis]|uniref:CARDB domain-containing protein n=1 Tax=Kinneretia aquatilis TaxID=2070761 RepID=UPI0014951F46|nr:CARDB domain-containing protein [Paucibacter aquatile]WIV97143.1 CARDB domain-containing protein [Paucibacter aquatile]
MSSLPTRLASAPRLRPVWAALALSSLVALTACGGGGGGGGEVTPPPPPPPTPAPDLMVTMSLPDAQVPSGYTQTMATIKLRNVGKGVAATTDVNIVADALLEGMKVVNCQSDNAGTACPATGSRMTVSNLQPGATLTFDVTGTVKLGTSGTVNLEASATTGTGTQLSSSKMGVGFKAYSADVAVQATGPSSAVPAGGSFEYVVTVSNKGPDAAKDVLIANQLVSSPSENAAILGTMSCSASGGAVCPTELKAVGMTVASLPKDGSLVFRLPYSFAPGQRAGLVFEAAVRARGDSDSSNDRALLMTP